MRILALDVGTKTIGVAVSDSEEKMALGVTTLARRSLAHDCAEVKKLAASREARLVVVGWPLTALGGEGKATERTQVFVDALRAALGEDVPVETFDERFTTTEATRLLSARGLTTRKQRRGAVDAVAAALILESYMVLKRGSGGE